MDNLETDNKILKKSARLNIFGVALKICGLLLITLLARFFGAAEFGIFVSTQILLLWASDAVAFLCMMAIFIGSPTPFILAELLILVALGFQWWLKKRRLA
jgi:hypothetical protein